MSQAFIFPALSGLFCGLTALVSEIHRYYIEASQNLQECMLDGFPNHSEFPSLLVSDIPQFGFNSEKHSSECLTLRMCLNPAFFFFFSPQWKRRLMLSALQSKTFCHSPTGCPPYFSNVLAFYFRLRISALLEEMQK